MRAYADETFYTGVYLQGKEAVVTTAFGFYARQASAQINAYLGSSVPDEPTEEMQLCCCELAELLFTGDTSEATQKQGIASESVQGWSQSYESSESRQTAQQGLLQTCLRKWLGGVSAGMVTPQRRWHEC